MQQRVAPFAAIVGIGAVLGCATPATQYGYAGPSWAPTAPGPASAGAGPSAGADSVGREGQVYINRVRIAPEQLQQLAAHGLNIPNGRYWYDRRTGAFGVEGGPTAGFIYAGMDLGGQLPADASGGGTGVFVNGRELHVMDVLALQQLFGQPVARGRYWLDDQGYAGYEGGPPLVNLLQIARQRTSAGGQGYIYRGIGGNMGSDGNCFYFNDPGSGSSVMGGGC